MTLSDEIHESVRDILKGDYEVQEARVIPEPRDVPHGKVAKKIKLVALVIDIRDSTGLLEIHEKQTAGKIHKAFLNACARLVQHNDGYIRSFRGDGLLALWPASPNGCDRAVRAAMQMKFLLDVKLKEEFSRYRAIDFGIGIDIGDAFIVRAGVARDENANDLVFISEAVNYAVHVADQAKGPNHVEICIQVYKELSDDCRLGKDSGGGSVDMWTDCKVFWRGSDQHTKCTTWYREC